jgi:hypothetical protein
VSATPGLGGEREASKNRPGDASELGKPKNHAGISFFIPRMRAACLIILKANRYNIR